MKEYFFCLFLSSLCKCTAYLGRCVCIAEEMSQLQTLWDICDGFAPRPWAGPSRTRNPSAQRLRTTGGCQAKGGLEQLRPLLVQLELPSEHRTDSSHKVMGGTVQGLQPCPGASQHAVCWSVKPVEMYSSVPFLFLTSVHLRVPWLVFLGWVGGGLSHYRDVIQASKSSRLCLMARSCSMAMIPLLTQTWPHP